MSSQASARDPQNNVDSLFHQRWSPRSFLTDTVPDTVLLTAFEAARWAPSGINLQPWRFVYSKRESATFAQFQSFVAEGNLAWAKEAGALVFLLSKKDFVWQGETKPSTSHSFDAGAAWMSFALQLQMLGYHAHAMGGILRDKIRAELNVPENYAIEVGIAVGKLGDKSKLAESFQAREAPSPRQPLSAIVSEGELKADWR